jgi:lactoylglutathione lyase
MGMAQVCVISVYVTDMEKAIDFYGKVLGFEVNKRYGDKIVSLVHEGVPIVLEEHDQTTGGSGIVLGLQTDDVYQTANELKDQGVELLMPEPADCPPGKYISFKDPFGNILEYLQFIN